MSDLNNLDLLQKKILQAKFSQLFKHIGNEYNSPTATQKLVNLGIATKISAEYNPPQACYQSERNNIAKNLSIINFTAFFTSIQGADSKDKKTYFLFKTPKNFLNFTSSGSRSFINYVIRQYCNIVTSEKLSEIYFATLVKEELNIVQIELKKAMLEIVTVRTPLTTRLGYFFENAKNKREITYGLQLKKAILKSNSTKADTNSTRQFGELCLIKSLCNKK